MRHAPRPNEWSARCRAPSNLLTRPSVRSHPVLSHPIPSVGERTLSSSVRTLARAHRWVARTGDGRSLCSPAKLRPR